MSKKKSGLLIAFGAMLGGAVAAGISYYLKLKSFNDELDQDFHEYEEEETPSEETEEKTEPAPERTYITINSGKDTNAADDSVKKEETKDSEETACPEPTDEKDSVKEENVPEEKTSSVVVAISQSRNWRRRWICPRARFTGFCRHSVRRNM